MTTIAKMVVGGTKPPRRHLPVAGPVALTAVGWLVGVAVTVAVIGSSSLVFGVHSPTGHLLLDTVDACVALLLTFLLWGRFRRSRRVQDLLLAQALLLLAAAGTVPGALAALAELGTDGTVEVWIALATRVTAAALILSATLVGRERLLTPRRRLAAAVPVLALLGVLVMLWWTRDALPVALSQGPPAPATRPSITGHPALLIAQLFGALAFAVASVGFAMQASRRRDALLLWLGPACALAAFARVNYFLFPSLYSDWLYAGDLLRTASYAVLLIGAAREISNHWSGWATATVLDDRRRLARELHDGVVQELGYIRSTATMAVPDAARRAELVGACDRAIDEARAAVEALGRSPDEPLGFVLHRAARQVADRYGGRVLVDLDDSVHVGHTQRHALVRITREAVSNAIRHGRAESVCVRLERCGEQVRLAVQDDGHGFDPATSSRGTGYGLTSMRERAAALPAAFTIESQTGVGTTVAVTWSETTSRSITDAWTRRAG